MSTYAISRRGLRIGTVVRFAGNEPAERWVAYGVELPAPRGFRTRRQAIDWLAAESPIVQRTDKNENRT